MLSNEILKLLSKIEIETLQMMVTVEDTILIFIVYKIDFLRHARLKLLAKKGICLNM